MRDLDKIKDKVDKRKQQLQPLFDKDKENYDLWVGKEQIFDTHKMAINITGTEMTALGRRVLASLVRSKLDIHVLPPEPIPNPKAEETANREEDMYYFGFNQADERLSLQGEASLLSSVAWQAVVLGRTATRIFVYQNDDGEIVWDFMPMIPSLLTFEFGLGGLLWYNYETFRSPECVYNEYKVEVKEKSDGKGVSVSDYWDRDNNVRYLTDSKEVLQSEKNPFGEVPAIIQPVTLGPKIITTEGIDVTAWGQSIYDHVKIPFKNLNKLRSVVATQAHLNAKLPLDVQYEGDRPDFTDEHVDFYPGSMFIHSKESIIKSMDVKDVPPSILTMMGDISTGIQRATYAELSPDVPAHSGSALKILRQDMQDVLTPRAEALNILYTRICRMVKKQIQVQKLKIPVKTVVNDQYSIYDMKPKMLDNKFHVSAEFIRQDVYDEVEMLQEAQLYQQNKWLSRSSVMEQKLREQDVPTEIMKMKIEDIEAAIPELTIPDVILKYREMGLEDKANELLRQFAMLVIEKQQALMPQPQGPMGQPQGPMGQPTAPTGAPMGAPRPAVGPMAAPRPLPRTPTPMQTGGP